MTQVVKPSLNDSVSKVNPKIYSYNGGAKAVNTNNNTQTVIDYSNINYNQNIADVYTATAAKKGGFVSKLYSYIKNEITIKFNKAIDTIEGKIESILKKFNFFDSKVPDNNKEHDKYFDYENSKKGNNTTSSESQTEAVKEETTKESPKPGDDNLVGPMPVEEPEKEETTKEEPKPEEKVEEKPKEEETTEKPKSNSNNQHFDIPLSNDEQDIVYECAEKYDLDPAIVFAVIETESTFDKNIGINSYHCAGLMQMNLDYSQPYGVTYDNYTDVYTNVNGGCMLLSELYKKYGNYDQALMAYNFGESGAQKHWKRGEYSSVYSRKVMSRADKYR